MLLVRFLENDLDVWRRFLFVAYRVATDLAKVIACCFFGGVA